MRIQPFGEQALYIDLEHGAPATRAASTWALADHVRALFPQGDVVVGAGTVVVDGVNPETAAQLLEASLSRQLLSAPRPRPTLHRVRVVYDGPDLEFCARQVGLTPRALAELHASRTYHVEFLGFLPGFAYLGPLPSALSVPRRTTPRARVPAGSLAMAGEHTAIYPLSSAGGWNLIGRVLGLVPFDPIRSPPTLFAPGDGVRFVVDDSD